MFTSRQAEDLVERVCQLSEDVVTSMQAEIHWLHEVRQTCALPPGVDVARAMKVLNKMGIFRCAAAARGLFCLSSFALFLWTAPITLRLVSSA